MILTGESERGAVTMGKISKLPKIVFGCCFIILYAPIFYLIYYSFNSGGTMRTLNHLRLNGIRSFPGYKVIDHCIEYIDHCFIVSADIDAIGVLGRLRLRSCVKRRRKEYILSLNNVLIVSPDVIIGASFLILFTMIGIKLGFISVLLSHIAFSMPIVVIMVLPKLQEMSPTLIDAARDLGASNWDILTQVIFHILNQVYSLDFSWR